MKTLVVYDSRHGFTQKCVELVRQELAAGLTLWPLRDRADAPAWADFDRVVVGGPVYFGRFSPRAAAFLIKHATVLQTKACHLFVVGLSPRAAALGYLKKGVGAAWAPWADSAFFFGGAIQWNKLTWWEKWVLKRARQIETDASNFDLQEVHRLVDALKK